MSEHLVDMANDIGAYFTFEPDMTHAVQGIVGHIERFWEPRMRQKLLRHFATTAGKDFDPLVRRAIGILATQSGAVGNR